MTCLLACLALSSIVVHMLQSCRGVLQWLVLAVCMLETWLLFVCLSSNEIPWQLIYISLSTCCTTYESIQKSWRDVLTTIYISRSFWLRNISWFLFTCSNSDETLWLTICLAVYDHRLHVWIVKSCSMFDRLSRFWFDHICSKMFSSKCSIRCVSHRRFDQKWFVWVTFSLIRLDDT